MSKSILANYKRYCHSLDEIEQELKQITENFESLYEGAAVQVDVNPYPKAVKYDGQEKEFLVSVKVKYNI